MLPLFIPPFLQGGAGVTGAKSSSRELNFTYAYLFQQDNSVTMFAFSNHFL